MEKPWGEVVSVRRGMREEAQMMTVSITEVAATMSMEAMFLMRNSFT